MSRPVTLLSDPEAQTRLAVSRTTLYRLRRDGLIQFVVVGAAVRYRADVIDRIAREGAPRRAVRGEGGAKCPPREKLSADAAEALKRKELDGADAFIAADDFEVIKHFTGKIAEALNLRAEELPLNCHEGRPTPPSMKTVSLCCAVGASAVKKELHIARFELLDATNFIYGRPLHCKAFSS